MAKYAFFPQNANTLKEHDMYHSPKGPITKCYNYRSIYLLQKHVNYKKTSSKNIKLHFSLTAKHSSIFYLH